MLHTWLVAVATVFAVVATTATVATDNVPSADNLHHPPSVLFIGNSYTYTHDVPGLVASLLSAHYGAEARVGSYAHSAYLLRNHSDDLHGRDSKLVAELSKGWDVACFQEQSQVPGFFIEVIQRDGRLAGSEALVAAADLYRHAQIPARLQRLVGREQHPQWQESYEALLSLVNAARAAHIHRTLLYGTWAYPAGDQLNPKWFPDYFTMQLRNIIGTIAYGIKLKQAGYPAEVAPVGLAHAVLHRQLHEQQQQHARGEDRISSLSDLTDASNHPTVEGAYLAALVLANSISKQCLKGDVYMVDKRVTLGKAVFLQELACEAAEAAAAVLPAHLEP